jgi:PEP-CTERM motif
MKTFIKILSAVSVLALATAAQANTAGGVTVNETDGLGLSWLGTPTFATFPNPTPLANVGNGGNAYSAEGNFNQSAGVVSLNEPYGFGGLAQTFSLTTGGTLTDLQFGFSGGATTLGLFIFDLGPASAYTVATSSTFTPSYNGGAANLLPNGLQFTYNGGAAGALNIADANFTGTGINLLAGEEYAVALEPTANPAMQWSRSGAVVNPPDQEYRYNQFGGTIGQYGALNGAVRVASLAVTVTPEPTTMALMGAGIALCGLLIRRRKA